MSAAALVTGISVTAPNGFGTEDYWAATLRGENGIRGLTRFDPDGYPTTLAGEISGFTATDHLSSRLVPSTDRMTQLALAAADKALADAEVDPKSMDEFAMGVSTASASGGFDFGQRQLENLWSKGPKHVSAYMSYAWFYAVNSGQLSIRNGTRGPSGVLVSEQVGGLDAVGHARRGLRKGLRLVLTGGMDSSLSPYGWVCQLASGRLSTSADPSLAYLPFDARAAGHVPGEGGAILVVEQDCAEVRARAPRLYGRIAGYAATFDPPPGAGRPPTLRRAAELALADARIGAGDVDVVFADAAAIPKLDRSEAKAITELCGPRGVPVTAPKTMTGRMYSGGAAVDLATALLAIRDQVIPPTTNVTQPFDDCELDLVLGQPREAKVHTALVLARGFGGFNSAMVVRAVE